MGEFVRIGLVLAVLVGFFVLTWAVPTMAAGETSVDMPRWEPMAGSPPAEAGEVNGRAAVRLRCPLAGTSMERASWDGAVELDLTAGEGVEFDVWCPDASPVSRFGFYFQSGDGWYAGSFAAPPAGEWGRVRVNKADTAIEGRPAGWGRIRTLRVSAWRGLDRDTELAIANIRADGVAGTIALIRGESAAGTARGEVESVRSFTQQMAERLREIGVSFSLISDLDVSPQVLGRFGIAILPHNPATAEPADAALAEFAQAGGGVVAFYGMPPALAKAVGLRSPTHRRASRAGEFSTISPREGFLPGAPAAVRQRSWNITSFDAGEGPMKVVADWLDSDENNAGEPAILASDRVVYMSHVLLTDDPAGKQQLLLAMLGRLRPAVWSDAAKAAIERANEIQVDAARDLKSGVLIAEADMLLATAAASAESDPPRAIALARQARDRRIDAWCQSQQPVAEAFRGVWCHRADGVAGVSWEDAIARLGDNGFNAVLPNVCWGGLAYYPSDVLPVADGVSADHNPLADCLAAAKKHGVKVHAWKVNWNTGGHAPAAFLEKMKREVRTQVSFDGTAQDGWLCPSHPGNQLLEIDAMIELATRYDVDGIHFDYIRYPDADHCFCAGCRERFEKEIGRAIADWPGEVRRDGELGARWRDFRRAQINRVVQGVSDVVRRERPGVKISAAVFPNWSVDRDLIGQDWKLWCERGWVDFVCPMNYTASRDEFDQLVSRQREWAGPAGLYPGIGLSVWPGAGRDAMKLATFIQSTRAQATGGFTIFEYDQPMYADVLQRLGMGVTRPAP